MENGGKLTPLYISPIAICYEICDMKSPGLLFKFLKPQEIILEWLCLCLVAQSCPTLCCPMDCSPPGSSVHGIFQARILKQVAISYSRGSS